jgi:CheY-like chemotaxis protein
LIKYSKLRVMGRKQSRSSRADNDSRIAGPDLLLLDMHPPKYDGEAILKRLRSTECYAQIPVIVMTSSDAPQAQDRAQKHAAIFYFSKPSRLEEFIQLGAIVSDILTGKKAQVTEAPAAGMRGDAA